MKNSIILFIVSITLILGVLGITNNFKENQKEFNKVNKRDALAMFVENEDGTYTKYENKGQPNLFPKGYYLNVSKSICTDINGKIMNGLISSSVNSVTLSSGFTTLCDLYFDIDDIAPSAPTIRTVYRYLNNAYSSSLTNYTEGAEINNSLTTISDNPQITFENIANITNPIGVYIKLRNSSTTEIPITVYYSISSNEFVNYVSGKTISVDENTQEILLLFEESGNWSNFRFEIGDEVGITYEIEDIALIGDNGISYNNPVSLYLESDGSESGIDHWEYSSDNSSWNEYNNSTLNTFMTSDEYTTNQTIYIRAIDKAGNEGASSSVQIVK